MPIYKLIKKYDSCPIDWKEDMLFTCSQHNQELYRPLNKMNSGEYVTYDFIITHPDNWKLHENDNPFKDGVDIFFIPKRYKKDFVNIIEVGLKSASVSKEAREFLEQYSNKNSNNDFPGSINL